MLKQKIEPALQSLYSAFASLKEAEAEQALGAGTQLSLPQKDLEHLLSMSDFVCRVCEQYPHEMLDEIIKLSHNAKLDFNSAGLDPNNIDSVIDYDMSVYRKALNEKLRHCQTEPDLLDCIRRFRQVQMASIACFDILHKQDIVRSMQKTSALADLIVSQTYLWLFKQACDKHGEPQPMQHLQIMAMGKLGGRELNFSSDIDLIFAFNSAGTTAGEKKPIEHQVFFTRLAQKLIYALDHITAHGRCFRVDMRLRPLGDSGPLVMPFSAFESYYQEQGRAWERFAMQKMRVISVTQATDPHTEKLYALVHPFVYRKYVDFTTIEAIREMKLLIEKEVRRRQLSNNIKLGKGGIREVEFFVQALQLIHAGREPQCQGVSTLGALRALTDHRFVSLDDATALRKHYLYLRKVEHYLQIFDDQQTQLLPSDEGNQGRLIVLLGHDNFEQVLKEIAHTMGGINAIFASFIQDPQEAEQAGSGDEWPLQNTANRDIEDLWDLSLDATEASALLDNILDEQDIVFLHTHVNDFKQKLQKQAVSERGMRSVNRLLPVMLNEFSVHDKHLSHAQVGGIFGILNTITGRTTYIDLLLENPIVRKRLYDLSEKSRWVAEQIAMHPMLLDELLQPIYLQEDTLSLQEWKRQLEDELHRDMLRIDPEDIESIMDGLRQFKHACQLRIAAADLSGTMAINKVSDKLTLLAEVMLAKVLEYAWQHTTAKHGIPEGQSSENKGLGIAAYGKFGGIELSYGSDLDIVCLYDAVKDGQTDGSGTGKALSNQEFYIKLVQRLTHLCITKCYHGILYEIDLRLRPSGASGLLISHIDSFAEYQASTAWTWEHQALVRARFVIGDASLCKAFEAVRHDTLSRQRDEAELRKAVFDMREKMRAHLDKTKGADIDIKQCHGGIVDIEFIVQYWVLYHAHQHHELLAWSDNLRLLEVMAQINSEFERMATCLREHYLSFRHRAHRLQLAERQLAYIDAELEAKFNQVSNIYQQVLQD